LDRASRARDAAGVSVTFVSMAKGIQQKRATKARAAGHQYGVSRGCRSDAMDRAAPTAPNSAIFRRRLRFPRRVYSGRPGRRVKLKRAGRLRYIVRRS
jgi:hypothetical protein